MANWLNEIGSTAPQHKTVFPKDPLVPFDLNGPTSSKTTRSQSFPEGPLFNFRRENVQQIPRSALNSLPPIPQGRIDVEASPELAPLTRATTTLTTTHTPRRSDYGSRPGWDAFQANSTDIHESHYSWSNEVPSDSWTIYCVVGFKFYRAKMYIRSSVVSFSDEIEPGDQVIVEADRGWDLGQVLYTSFDPKLAEKVLETCNAKHLEALKQMSWTFAKYGSKITLTLHNVETDTSGPRFIKMRASELQIHGQRDKERMEQSVLREVRSKVAEHEFNMEVIDTEFQSDMQKITVYYYSPKYITFSALVKDLYKKFKCRVWMQAVSARIPAGVIPGDGLLPINPATIEPNTSQNKTPAAKKLPSPVVGSPVYPTTPIFLGGPSPEADYDRVVVPFPLGIKKWPIVTHNTAFHPAETPWSPS